MLISHSPPGYLGPGRLPSTQHCQFKRNCSCPTLSQLFLGLIARLRPNRVHSSATACLPLSTRFFQARSPVSDPLSLTQPCLFERNRSFPTSTRPFQARLLASQPRPFEHNCSCLTLSQLFLGPIACLRPNHVHSSATACLPHPLHPLEPNRSPPTQPRPFGPDRLSPTPHQAFSGLIARLQPNRVHSGTTTCLPLPPGPFGPSRLPPTHLCPFEHNCSCLTFTMSCQT